MQWSNLQHSCFVYKWRQNTRYTRIPYISMKSVQMNNSDTVYPMLITKIMSVLEIFEIDGFFCQSASL